MPAAPRSHNFGKEGITLRILMWLTLGFAAACALMSWLLSGWWLLLLAAIAAVCCAACVSLRHVSACRCAAVLLLGLTAGSLWCFCFDRLYVSGIRQLDGQTVPLELTVSSYSWETDYGSAVDGRVKLDGKSYTLRVYLNEQASLRPGDVLRFSGKLRLTADGGASEPTYHRSNGILALCYQRGSIEYLQPKHTLRTRWDLVVQTLRENMLNRLETCFPAGYAAFAKALLLGDRSGISYTQSTAFKLSGISHIIAVSGLHVSMLYGLVFWLSRGRRAVLALAGIPLTLLFMAVAAFTPSVTRAGIMQILLILALCLDREYDPLTALSAACLAMLLLNPLVISGVSFSLSAGSVCGIFLFAEPIRSWLLLRFPKRKSRVWNRLRAALCVGVSTTVSAQIITMPLVAVCFRTVSLVSVLTNLLVLWAVSIAFWGVIAVGLLGGVWLAAGKVLAGTVCIPMAFILKTAQLLSVLPLAAVSLSGGYTVFWLALFFGLLLTLPLHKRPLICICLAALGLCFCLLLGWLEGYLYPHQVTVLDVGQGQCVILRSGNSTFVVDCGGDYPDLAADACADELLALGLTRIDGLILSHYDEDHSGGAALLLERVRADRVFLPPGTLEETEAILRSAKGQIVWLEEDTEIRTKTARLSLFTPISAASSNERSVAVLFQTENCDTLITGDMSTLREALLLRRAALPELELLVAGHHGSDSSTSALLLEQLKPEHVAISVGTDNRYDHPAQAVLQRLAAAQCKVYRTDLQGTIRFRR